MKHPPLYNHQVKFLERDPDKALLVWGVGSGKSRTACEWAKKRGSTLIICPRGLCENWRRECERWGLNQYTIISKEMFKKECKSYNFRVVICDESDHFYSAFFKSALSRAMRWYIKYKNPNILFLSATPYRSSAWNIYTAGTLLGYEWPFQEFKYTFFDEIRMGPRIVPIPKKGSEVKLKALIETISDVFRTEDGFDIPPQIDETIYSEESKSQQLAKKNNQEILPIVRFTRDHQTEAGIGNVVDNKIELIKQYAIDEPKVAVVCRYRAQLDKYARVLRTEGHTVYEIHGDVDNRSEVLDEVEASEKCILMLQSATCEGYEAPSISLMIFASMDYSYRNYCQVKGRILRMNRLHKNVYIHLICGKSDQAVMDAMLDKQDFDILKFYAGEKNYPKDFKVDEGRPPF